MKISNRKTATRLLLVQWSRFQNVSIKLEGSTLITGVNGSGKSTVLDAMTYLLTGNTQFNKAAKDRDRTVKGYVRGDTKSNGAARYLRTGPIVSYIVMEFWSPDEEKPAVAGVCIESPDEISPPSSYWFVYRDGVIEDFNFTVTEGNKLYVTPKKELRYKNQRIKSAEFMGRDKGVEQLMRALGLRCNPAKYRQKLLKMMAFNPENNIDQFISECVLEPGKIDSLKELREQREQFEKLRKLYEDLKDGKEQLEKIEEQIQEYEKRKRNLETKKLMMRYQELLGAKEEMEEIGLLLSSLRQQSIELEKKRKEIEEDFEKARNRLQIAETNDLYRGMQESIRALEERVRDLTKQAAQNQEEIALLLKLQNALGKDLKWCFDEFSGENRGEALRHLAEEGYPAEEKRRDLTAFFKYMEEREENLQRDRVHKEDEKRDLQAKIAALDENIKRLEANQLVFPEEIVRAREVICREFQRRNIQAEVRIFAELVREIRDETWRKAIETFLGRKRYYIIVEGRYCHDAIEILQEKRLYAANVVLTDKLPESESKEGSAAEQLVIPNPYGRRYADYLLNGIHLCGSLEELHEYPKGGLMKDGMLAKSYAVSCMNMERTRVCLGQEAIELQRKELQKQRKEKEAGLQECALELAGMQEKRKSLKSVERNSSLYRLEAPELYVKNRAEKKQLEKEIRELTNSTDFLAVVQEQQNAKKAYDAVDSKRTKQAEAIGECQTKIRAKEREAAEKEEDIRQKMKEYEEERSGHLELEAQMMSEYRKQRKKRGTVRVLAEKTVQGAATDLDKAIRLLEDMQLEYCRISEIDINRRGIGYIPFFRKEYQNVANAKIEEARVRLDAQAGKLESAFMNDFVAEMNETIMEAKREINLINAELKQIPFGQDTYKFKMEEKADRKLFFRICRKLEEYTDSPELYMNFARNDEEMERDIQEFMEMILDEENEEEYTDYRRYFTYDMEISSHQGEEKIISELSKKQGSASNGEKQTPYFIILAASLLQCYPKTSCCVRLAFIDEAFSALSRERIEQMVKYLEDNCFQVIYAAPPEKIGSIGQFIQSTVSLISTGRYTNAVEGLVSLNEING